MGFGVAYRGEFLLRSHQDVPLRVFEQYIVDPITRLFSGERVSPALADTNKEKEFVAMVAATAFTPGNVRDSLPIVGDQPYSFLIGWTLSRTTVLNNAAAKSELTIGTIGSRLGRNAQRGIHRSLRRGASKDDPPDPKGWSNQVYDGALGGMGVPTLRYSIGKEARLPPLEWSMGARGFAIMLETVYGATAQVGYYDELNVNLRSRLGLIDTPFWSWRDDPLTPGSSAQPSTHRLKASCTAASVRALYSTTFC
jgi:hypothetical protein